MGLRSALVDSIHVVSRAAVGPKVAGETQMVDVLGPMFKGRVDMPTPQELREDQIQFVQYTRDATLLVATKDSLGAMLDLKGSDKIRVTTGPYAGDFEILGPPSPIRKKRKLIGWEIRLTQPRGREG